MRKIAFLFCGGGAQYPGMMEELCNNFPKTREVFTRADEIVGNNLSEICFRGSSEKLNETNIMIPAIFSADIAAYTALMQYEITPAAAAGFSLGEWAALVAAEVLPFSEAMRLVQLRSDAMTAATPKEGGGMAVIIGKPADYVEELCGKVESKDVFPANYNFPGQITVSGTDKGLASLEKLALEDETVYQRLPVNVPSHCILMKPAMEKLAEALENITFNSPKFPIYSNLTAAPTTDPDIIKKNIIEQLINPVRFEQTIARMIEDGVSAFVELGPGKTLSRFARKTSKSLEEKVIAVHVEDMETLNETLEKLND